MKQLVLYFVIVYMATWGICAVLLAGGHPGIDSPLFFMAVYVPSVTGVVLTASLEGKPGLVALGWRLNPFGFNPAWYLIVIVGMCVFYALGSYVAGQAPVFAGWRASLTGLALGLVFDPGPVGEELGWRGYALPRLLERYSPAVATLILGVVWGLWHLPVLVFPGFPQSTMGVAPFVGSTIALSTLATWAHLGTRGSVLIAILIHLMANHAGAIVGGTFMGGILGTMLAAATIFVLARKQMFRRPAPVSSPPT